MKDHKLNARDYEMTPEEEKEIDERLEAFHKDVEAKRKEWDALTPEEKEERRRKREEERKITIEESTKRWEAFYEKYGDKIRALKKGEEIKLECPKCGGVILAGRSSYNGHMHIMCENKCLMMIE